MICVRAHALGEGDRQLRPHHGLMKISLYVQMSDKLQDAGFTPFDSCLHDRHLLQNDLRRSRNIFPGSSALLFSSMAFFHSLFKNSLVTPISMKSQGEDLIETSFSRSIKMIIPVRFLPWLPSSGHSGNILSRRRTDSPSYKRNKSHRRYGGRPGQGYPSSTVVLGIVGT